MPDFNWRLGREAKLKVNNNPVNLAKEVTVELSGSEADVTTRYSDGVKHTVLALREWTISASVVYAEGDIVVEQLLGSYYTGEAVTVSLEDPSLVTTGKWVVTSVSFSQPLEDVVTLDVTLKPTVERFPT